MSKRKKSESKFTDIDPSPSSTSFYDKVYAVVESIPRGKVTSYGAIGETLGMKSSARLVGQAMSAVPDDLLIPAHRVVNRSGALTGAHRFGGYERMRYLLEAEGVRFKDDRVDMKEHFWHP